MPFINSILHNDLYKFSMSNYYIQNFPEASGTFTFHDRNNTEYDETFVKILKDELIPVNGCTEPVSIAYAASLAKKYLEEDPIFVSIKASRSIIKNVKAVVVPNTAYVNAGNKI